MRAISPAVAGNLSGILFETLHRRHGLLEDEFARFGVKTVPTQHLVNKEHINVD